MDWNDVLEHMRAHHILAGATDDFVEMWCRITVDGVKAVQHQVLFPAGMASEPDGEPYVMVACEVHCMDPLAALRYRHTLAVGSLAIEEGRAVLRQSIAATGLTPAHLDRVLAAMAETAARLAQLMRLDVTAPMPAMAR